MIFFSQQNLTANSCLQRQNYHYRLFHTLIGSLKADVGSFMDVNQQHAYPSFLFSDGSKLKDGLL